MRWNSFLDKRRCLSVAGTTKSIPLTRIAPKVVQSTASSALRIEIPTGRDGMVTDARGMVHQIQRVQYARPKGIESVSTVCGETFSHLQRPGRKKAYVSCLICLSGPPPAN